MFTSSVVKELRGEDFDNEVLHSSKPVILDIYTEHCGSCKILAPLLESLASEHAEELTVLKADAVQSPDLAARFSVRSVPTLLFFREGQLRHTHHGTLSKEGMLKKIRG